MEPFIKDDRRYAREHCDKAPKEILLLILTDKYSICPLRINLPHGDVPPSVDIKRELSLPDPQFDNSPQLDIAEVFHWDGLLLCTGLRHSKIVVWNPFTGQTRWIEAGNRKMHGRKFVLEYYYQDNKNKSCSKRSYKILWFDFFCVDTEIYELNSCHSWRRIPDGDLTPPGWYANRYPDAVFLKGSCYYFGIEKSEPRHLGFSLIRFDFSTEKSSLFVPFPYQCSTYGVLGLSIVREEKLSVFVHPDASSKTEIWVTTKIDETTKVVVSWSKVLTLDLSSDLQIRSDVFFLLEEDKKFAMFSQRLIQDDTKSIDNIVFLAEDNNKVSEFGVCLNDSKDYGEKWRNWPVILYYVPSLVQIELPKRGD